MNNHYSKIHVVKKGETLSLIAKKYGFTDWKPIYNFNTKIHKVLGANPDQIREATKIIIPRSSPAYFELIRKLEKLKIELGGVEDRLKIELDSNMLHYEFFKESLDTLSSILTVSVSVGLSGGAKAVSAVKRFDKVISKKPFINKLVTQTKELIDTKSLGGKLRETAFDKFNQQYVDEKNQEGLSLGYKSIKNGYKLGAKGLTVMNCADSLLDFMSPSKLADMIMWFSSETVSQTDRNSREKIKRTIQQQVNALNQKINELIIERTLTYG